MFYNRVYFTCRQRYHLLKYRPNYNRKLVTFNNPNGRGNGDGPNYEYVITAILVSSGFYMLRRDK